MGIRRTIADLFRQVEISIRVHLHLKQGLLGQAATEVC